MLETRISENPHHADMPKPDSATSFTATRRRGLLGFAVILYVHRTLLIPFIHMLRYPYSASITAMHTVRVQLQDAYPHHRPPCQPCRVLGLVP
jgi:hypothetical protein